MLPFSELKINAESPVLYQGLNGLILKGCYCSINVAVKRLLPPSIANYKSLFGQTTAQTHLRLHGGLAHPKVRRLSAQKGKDRAGSRPSSPLLSSPNSQVCATHC